MTSENPSVLDLQVAIIQVLQSNYHGLTRTQNGRIQETTYAAMANHESTTSNLRTLLSSAEELKSRVEEIVRRL